MIVTFEEDIFSPRKDSLLQTKTNCFAIMMVYDAFAKRVISPNKQIFNGLASIMMLFKVSPFLSPLTLL